MSMRVPKSITRGILAELHWNRTELTMYTEKSKGFSLFRFFFCGSTRRGFSSVFWITFLKFLTWTLSFRIFSISSSVEHPSKPSTSSTDSIKVTSKQNLSLVLYSASICCLSNIDGSCSPVTSTSTTVVHTTPQINFRVILNAANAKIAEQ